jgi:hypothetical protein
MSVDLNVTGFAAPDKKYKQMLNVLNACKEANIVIPDDVDMFFDGNYNPDPDGMEVSLGDCITNDKSDWCNERIIDVSLIPSNVTHIKVYME